MPKFDLPQPSAADVDSAPSTRSTVVPTERSVYDLFTGGWHRRLTGLPTALRGTLAQWAGRGRSTVAGRRGRPGQDAAHR
ncbi:MAG TPA: hypothetical protein VH372_03770 [Actinospica sp.]|jgi:hypothetical protein|nr:hypothetical protein [Actinospica sp.]